MYLSKKTISKTPILKNKTERLKYLLHSDTWSNEDKIWLEQYLSGDFGELEQVAADDFQQDIKNADRLITEAESIELLKKLHERVGIKPAGIHKLWPGIAVAASLAIVVFGILFYNYSHREIASQVEEKIVITHDLAPGKNSAVLTLSDGRVIQLSDSKSGVLLNASNLKYNDGSILQDSSESRSPDIFINGQKDLDARRIAAASYSEKITISTPPGGTYEVTLPDGTNVWLNAASSVTYTRPSKHKDGIRKVDLKGEAYFEVYKNKDQPFVVESEKMELTVLGTHFNLNAYNDEASTKATLLEGSVRVNSTFDEERGSLNHQGNGSKPNAIAVILKPSQQAIVSAKKGLMLKDVDASDAVAWKNGTFLFEDADLQTVMRQISRWYNLKIVYRGEIPRSTYNGKISRGLKLSKVLEVLKYYKVRFTLNGRTLIVEP